MNDEEIAEKLKIVFAACDYDDLKTKKFKGLLYDYIPNETGLKLRLEVLGQSGYLQKVLKLTSKKSDLTPQLNKLASEFSQAYGFQTSVILKTMTYVAWAMDIRPDLKVVPNVSETVEEATVEKAVSSGNFSKKHLGGEGHKVVLLEPEPIPSRKPTVKRNKPWLFQMALLIFIGAFSGGYYYLLHYFGDNTDALNALMRVYEKGYTHPIIAVTLSASFIGLIASILLYKYKKYNLVILYPVLIIFIELVAGAFYVSNPALFELIQLSIMGFLILGMVYAMIPAFTKRMTTKVTYAKQVLLPYYLTGILFIGSQILVRQYF